MTTIPASRLPDHLAEARKQYANDRVKIEDDARMREAPKGVWVQAWLWVPDNEVVIEVRITGL